LPKLQKKYGDKIAVAYRHLPLMSHPNSRLEAQVGECVATLAGNKTFWDFAHAVFAIPGFEKGLSLDALTSIAGRFDIQNTKLRSCVASGAVDARIDEDALEASVAGITETPSTVLKSATRALIVQGNYYSQLDIGIGYLLYGK